MDSKTALHTAARRFCQDRYSEWSQTYNQLQIKGKERVESTNKFGWSYSEEAYRIFPRYRIDALIQIKVEGLVPDSSRDLEELRSQLVEASAVAEARILEEFTNAIAIEALREEVADFSAYIKALGDHDLSDIAALPYRRVLTEEESKRLWNTLKRIWDIGNGYWFPLREGPIPADVLAFHVDYFVIMGGSELLRDLLRNHGVSRVFQLAESTLTNADYEIELSILEPRYTFGDENYCTSDPFDWVVYASHESSITICGDWLIKLFKERCPDWSQRAYGGPFSTNDMRGTWKTN